MEIQPKKPRNKGPAEMFAGDVWFDVIAKGEDPSQLRVNMVRFSPGAHTAWHSHANGQTLHVTEGRGLVQSRGGEVIEIRPGDTIYTPPGEEHCTAPRRAISCATLPCGKPWAMARRARKTAWGRARGPRGVGFADRLG